MDKFIVKNLDIRITDEEMLKKLRIADDPEDEDCRKAVKMLKEALACAKPKYACTLAAIEEKGNDHVVVEGRRIASPLVRQNLDKIHRILPYVATCGAEADLWSRQYSDMIEHFWADEIKNMILYKSIAVMRNAVKEKYYPGSDMSQMSPGSLPAWPVTEQAVLFDLLDGVNVEIGVSLTDSFLMIPSKSVSGFFFSSETHYENCRLCPMRNCPNRSAAYQPPADNGEIT